MQVVDMNDPEVIESLKYLLVPKEERIRVQAQPFDGKKNCFIVDHKEGFVPAEIQSTEGNMVTVKTSKGETQKVKQEDIQQMNPPKYEKCDDMADLTYLNDATVLHNLRTRYQSWYIYTYSGLFCVAINPYKRLPVYTMKMVALYRGKKKNEVPPHLYLVADLAYACMMRDRENQSMLITGESGAGKTENTKKVIQYFAFVASAISPKKHSAEDANKPSLEDQIVSANPVLEAYGNAKTTRNNNSSRFGKFIRIHFSSNYGIAGADIESYLLEKSRITFQQPAERNYHIFYQLLSPAFPDLVKDLLLECDPSKYFFINQGMLTIDGVDDCQEMKDTKKAFDILNFSQQQQLDLFKNTAAVTIFGNSKWKQKPREEQAEADGTEEVEKVASLLSVNQEDLLKGLLKPRIKVGNEYVNKGQSKAQVENAVGALSKAIYARCFNWLVERVNETLDAKEHKRVYFIGVLDIAGFEVFDYNGFEQLCINFTNERLQQFFNHFMFVLEQEEYQKEGIQWEMMNFGLDLQACIDLIEKPLGIFSILEEECIVPKATDKTFQEKLYSNHLGKHPSFGKPKPQKGKAEAHFDLHHYAGTVSYNVTGWLEKNKDPINTTVAALFKASKGNALLSYLFQDIGVEETAGKKSKSGSNQTISSGHREQLNKLMNTLKQTHPHFVRCIIPNEIKTGGVLDAHLVLHQLHCNGVLEGIRICRKGFPSRVLYAEFVQRYSILAPNEAKANLKDPKKAASEIIRVVNLNEDLYRIGLTKVLLRAGVVGALEEYRDIAVSKILTMLQAWMRIYLMKREFKQRLNQRLAQSVIQRNLKAYITLRNWSWWKLFTKIKPLLQNSKKEEEEKAKLEEFNKIKEEKEKGEALRKELEEKYTKLAEEKNALYTQLQAERDNAGNAGERVQKLESQKANLESQVKELEDKLSNEESNAGDLNAKKKKLEQEINDLKKDIDDLHIKLNKSDSENKSKENQIRKLQDEMAHQDESIAKLTKEKKRLEELNAKTAEQLQQEEDKASHLNKVKSKLEQTIDEAEDNLEREKKGRADLDKAKRRLEGDLKNAQSQIEELEKMKKDLEDNLKRKESEINNASAKIEDEHSQLTALSKKIKELQTRLDESQEETEAERQARAKAEKQRSDLSRELDELNSRLEEAGGATTAQLDLNKKREAELAKLRRDLEEANLQHEATAAQLRKKHQDAVNEMGEQIDQLQKAKNKLEKEKALIKSQVDDARLQTESANKSKINVEKVVKQLELQLQELSQKLDESSRHIMELNSQKSKLQSENSNLISQIEEVESQANGFVKIKQTFQLQVEEAKRIAEEESRAKTSLASQLKNLTSDLDSAREAADEEATVKVELQKLVSKLTSELQQWRSKYETESLSRAEELEEAKRKLAAKLLEAEEQVEQALAKCNSLEKTKQRLQNEVEDLMVDVERANSNASSMEKKQKQFDKLIGEWKQKCEDITLELEASQKEARQYSTELFKLKTQYEESHESIEALRRENKNLAEEIKDLMDQLGEGGKSVHELIKSRKRLEVEKEELQVALENAEGVLEQEEAKVLRMQLELGQVRQEIDRRLHEKEEEFENTRRNHQRVIESMQASLEAETKGKVEALRQKKKLEGDINELEIALDHSNRANADLQKCNKKLQQLISELQSQVEEEQRQRDEAREAVVAAERRVNLLTSELEEIRLSLEQAEKARKAAENDLHDAADRISDLSASNANLSAQKRKLDGELTALQADLDEAIHELKNSEERVKKASGDAARLAEELRQEQEHALNIEKLRKSLEQQVKDLQVRLDEAEANALKGGKRIIQKLEQRIHELETELDIEQRHHQETIKEVRKNDRRLKELAFQAEEDRKNQARLQDLVEKLQNKLKVYKRQVEEAEEIAAVNLAKFRKVQHELEDAEERTSQAENLLNKQRAKNRSTVSTGRCCSPQREVTITQRASSVVQTQTQRASSVRRQL